MFKNFTPNNFIKSAALSRPWRVSLGLMFCAAFLFFILAPAGTAQAATYFVSTTGSDVAAGTISAPWLTWNQALNTAAAGDTVYFRGGTYTVTFTGVGYDAFADGRTMHSGTATSTITLKAYPGETPVFTAAGVSTLVRVENPYWVFDGLTFVASNVGDIIHLGENAPADHAVIKNCSFAITESISHDNIACIKLLGDNPNYTLIQNNTFSGVYDHATGYGTNGVQYLSGNNVGTKILNNVFHHLSLGVYVKHANADTAGTGAEIAYNYLYDIDNSAFYGNPVYINYHDNLVVGSRFLFGDNGGGIQGHHCTINHNTVYNSSDSLFAFFLWPNAGPVTYFNVTNNVFIGRMIFSHYVSDGTDPHYTTLNYNLYPSMVDGFTEFGIDYSYAAWKTHYGQDANSLIGTPSFVGDLSTTSITGFALANGSAGENSASDGKDMGADVSLVGIQNTQVAPAQVYRSVGPGNTRTLASSTPSSINLLTVDSSGNATFGSNLLAKIGVGDAIIYDSNDSNTLTSADGIIFIRGRVSSSTYLVETENGATSTTAFSNNDTWSIYRSYTSLSNAISLTKNTAILVSFDATSSIKNISDNTATGTNKIWNIALYGDAIDTTNVTITGWTTATSTYMRIYTPYLSSEVGVSQRHNGKWDDSKYSLRPGAGLVIKVGHVIIDGLQVRTTTSAGSYVLGISVPTDGSQGVVIKNNIVKEGRPTNAHNIGIYVRQSNTYVYNNIVYGFMGLGSSGIFSDSCTPIIYNNTVVNSVTGFVTYGDVLKKNNLSFGNGSDYVGTGYNNAYRVSPAGSNPINLSGYATSSIFLDYANEDFRLVVGSPAIGVGANLTSDSLLSFSTDIQNETRPSSGAWNVGADEYHLVSGDVVAPIISVVASSTVGVGVNIRITWTTNEISTSSVRFGLTTAYGSASSSNLYVTSHSIILRNLSTSSTYHFQVSSADASGNMATSSDYSFVATESFVDIVAPTVPTNLSAIATSSSRINLSWTASTDDHGVVGYKIYRDSVQIGTSVTNSYNSTGLTASTTYSYTVAAYDAAGNTSVECSAVNETTLEASIPVISGLTGVIANGNSITLNGLRFGVRVEGAPIKFDDFEDGVSGTALSAQDSSWHVYDVVGVGYSSTSSHSGGLSVGTHINNGGSFNTNYYTYTPGSSEMFISYWWRTVNADVSDNTITKMTRMNSSLAAGGGGVYTGVGDTTLGGTFDFSTQSGPYCAYHDGESSEVVLGNLAFPPINQWIRVDMYKKLSTPGANDGAMEVKIYGVDAASDLAAMTRAAGQSFLMDTVLLGTMDGDSGSHDYEIYVDDMYIDKTQARVELCDTNTWGARTHCETQPSTAWATSSLSFALNQGSFSNGATAYLYVVDASGNTNASGYQVTISGGADVTAPTVPASLSATAISSSQINLSWASSTDAVGVTGYRIYRGGARIATTTNSSYFNTGLSASTLYSYTVSAYDAAGNISASSTAATSTTSVSVPAQIYRSVGPGNTRTLASSTPSSINLLTVDSSGNATFGSNLLAKIGVGDAIVYDSNDSNTLTSADGIIFIRGRVSSSTYLVETESGATSTTAFSNNDTWSIYRAYTSLANATDASANVINSSIIVPFDSFGGSKNLVSANTVWNIACYGDAQDVTGVTVTGWTTATSTYMRIYTPHLSSEVGVSQRHNGVWDDGKYSLRVSSANGITVTNGYIRIGGLQIVTGANYIHGIVINEATLSAWPGIYIDGNIVKAGSLSYSDNSGIYVRENGVRVYNNIIYDFKGASSFAINRNDGLLYLYNNTIVNSTIGVNNGLDAVKQNILFFGNATNYLGGSYSIDLSSYATSSIFVDYANKDFRLVAESPAIGIGVNLTNDSFLPFSADIQNESRPSSAAWDAGADEYYSVQGGDFVAPIISAVASSTTGIGIGVNIKIAWVTDEISTSTVKFGLNTGYGSASSSNSLVTSHSIILRNLSVGSTYHFQVSSADPNGNRATSSDYSFVAVESFDTTAPTIPVGLSATVFSPSQINLTWASSTDANGVAGYKIYRDGISIGMATTTSSYSDASLSATAHYSYTVSAYDASGNVSASSTSANATTSWSVISDLPQIISQPITKAYPGIEYNIRLGVIGGKARYTFGLDTAPSGMAISSNGTVTWTPGAGLNGQSFPVTYRVTDALGHSVTQSFSLSATTTGFYFVSTSGNDTTGTGAIGTPWATINKGLSSGSTGDTVYVRAGTYTQVWAFVSGKTSRIVAYPGEFPIADFNFQHGPYVRDSGTYVDGFEIKNIVFKAFQVNSFLGNLVFRRNNMHDLYDDSVSENPSFVYFWNGADYNYYNNVIFQDNKFHDLFDSNSGLHGDTSANYHGGSTVWYNVANSLYEDNEAYNIDGSGMEDKDNGLKNTFRGNYFYNNHESGLQLMNQGDEDGAEVEYNIFNGSGGRLAVGWQPGFIRNVEIRHNTFYSTNIEYRWVLGETLSTNFITRDNIFANQTTYTYYTEPGAETKVLSSSALFDYNIIQTTATYIFGFDYGSPPRINFSDWQTTYQKDLHSSLADPLLTDPANGNFTPLLGSPACTAGSDGGYVGALPCSGSGFDITAPTVPASLSATAVSPTQINLTWASSTDAVGVTGYRIYRGGARIATTTNSSYSNTGLSASTLYSYTVSAYDAAGNISASSTVATSTTFALSTYSIGGSISGLTGTVVLQNNGKDNLSRSANGSFTFATATTTGNQYSVTILTQPTGQTCIATSSSGTVSGANVTSVSITCTTNTFTITASTGANGTVTPSGVTTKNYGSSQAYTIATSTAGYHVADILVDGSSVGTSSLTYTFTNITANHTISATFNINHYTITSSVSGANGTISPLGATIVSYGATPTYTIATSTAGYHVADILVDGVSVGTSTLPYVFPAVHANHTIVASFSINHYTITASAGANGTVTPSGVTTKNYGTSQAYTIATSTAGYHVSNILVDGSPIGTSSLTYTFSNIITNHTISATFSNGSTPATYSIGGTISGLSGTVVLQNNGGDNKTISANGSFTFATDLASAASYLITVLTNPSNQTCTVLSDSGTVSGANVTSVSVTCTTNTCSTLSNTATYNAYPTCGAASCSSGYSLSGSGASATCVAQSSGGGGGSSTPTDTTAPGTPTNFSVHSTSSLTVLSWINPTASDFAGVKLYRKTNSALSSQSDTSATLIYQGKNTSYTDTSSKVAGISYYYSIYSFDAHPNYSQLATISIVISAGAGASTTPVVVADTTPPGLVTNFFASSSIDHVVLSWTKPSDADFAGVKIFHKVGSPLTSYKDVLASEIYQGNAQTFIDSGLLSGKDYYYSIYTYDNNLNYSNVVTTHAITGSGINIPVNTVPVANSSSSTVTTLIGATGATVNVVVAEESQKLIANAGFAPLTSPEIAIYKKTIALTSSSLTDEKKFLIADFIHYGTPTTLSLGAGERAGSVASFHSAFGRLPTSNVDWQDVIKIGNGRWTTQVNAAAEAKAKAGFKKIYLRDPNTKQASDNAAVNVMAYGLRPAARNMNSEKAAINSFRYIYKKSPVSAQDWDIVRAIAYSGAKR